VGAYVKDGDRIRQRGFLAGFTPLVWVVVALQAGGGLCTAAVIAYADNLLKGFATGVSMLLSVAASCVWFDFEITKPFLAGAASVVAAILLYSRA
jgi:UDP-galactose transporter